MELLLLLNVVQMMMAYIHSKEDKPFLPWPFNAYDISMPMVEN